MLYGICLFTVILNCLQGIFLVLHHYKIWTTLDFVSHHHKLWLSWGCTVLIFLYHFFLWLLQIVLLAGHLAFSLLDIPVTSWLSILHYSHIHDFYLRCLSQAFELIQKSKIRSLISASPVQLEFVMFVTEKALATLILSHAFLDNCIKKV